MTFQIFCPLVSGDKRMDYFNSPSARMVIGLFRTVMWEWVWATLIKLFRFNRVQFAGPFENFGQAVARPKNI